MYSMYKVLLIRWFVKLHIQIYLMHDQTSYGKNNSIQTVQIFSTCVPNQQSIKAIIVQFLVYITL